MIVHKWRAVVCRLNAVCRHRWRSELSRSARIWGSSL